MARKNVVNYLSNTNLLREIRLSKERLETATTPITKSEALTPELVTMLQLLVTEVAKKYNWRNYTYIEDMKAGARKALCESALKFDEEKTQNPFSYYTQIVWSSFVSDLEKEKRVSKIKDALLEECCMIPSFSRQQENEDEQSAPAMTQAEAVIDEQLKESIKARLELYNETITSLSNVEKLDTVIENLSKLFPSMNVNLALLGDFFEIQKCFPPGCTYDFTYNTEYKQVFLNFLCPTGTKITKGLTDKQVFNFTSEETPDMYFSSVILKKIPFDKINLRAYGEKLIMAGLLAQKDKIFNEHKAISDKLYKAGINNGPASNKRRMFGKPKAVVPVSEVNQPLV